MQAPSDGNYRDEEYMKQLQREMLARFMNETKQKFDVEAMTRVGIFVDYAMKIRLMIALKIVRVFQAAMMYWTVVECVMMIQPMIVHKTVWVSGVAMIYVAVPIQKRSILMSWQRLMMVPASMTLVSSMSSG